MLKIGTLNLNGEMWNLNGKWPRISKKIIDPEYIKEQMTDAVITQLGKILNKKEYDIIAIQELVYIQEHFSKIKKMIDNENYVLITPNSLGGNIHFTTAFIVKKNIEKKVKARVDYNWNNRFMAIDVETKDGIIAVCNFHISKDNISKRVEDVINKLKEKEVSKFIILGDFNAYTKEQDTKIISAVSENNIIYKVRNEYKLIECGKDTDYTYVLTKYERKLDHIFKSEEIKELNGYETINRKVNFMIDEKDGFTDHSMLNIEIDYDIYKEFDEIKNNTFN